MTEDFKIVPDKEDLKLEARMKRREEAEKAVKEYETKRRLGELKNALMGGLDMTIGVLFLTKSILTLEGEAASRRQAMPPEPWASARRCSPMRRSSWSA